MLVILLSLLKAEGMSHVKPVKWLSLTEVFVAQLLRVPNSIWVVVGSNPLRDSDFFCFVRPNSMPLLQYLNS